MTQYFVRRGTKAMGPLSEEKTGEMIKAKKLKPSDQISVTTDGPWDKLSEVYKDVLAGTYASAETVVDDFESDYPDDDLLDDYVDDGDDYDYEMPSPKRKKKPKASKSKSGEPKSAPNYRRIAIIATPVFVLVLGMTGFLLWATQTLNNGNDVQQNTADDEPPRDLKVEEQDVKDLANQEESKTKSLQQFAAELADRLNKLDTTNNPKFGEMSVGHIKDHAKATNSYDSFLRTWKLERLSGANESNRYAQIIPILEYWLEKSYILCKSKCHLKIRNVNAIQGRAFIDIDYHYTVTDVAEMMPDPDFLHGMKLYEDKLVGWHGVVSGIRLEVVNSGESWAVVVGNTNTNELMEGADAASAEQIDIVIAAMVQVHAQMSIRLPDREFASSVDPMSVVDYRRDPKQ